MRGTQCSSTGPAAYSGSLASRAPTALRTSCEVSRRVGTVRGGCSCAAAAACAAAAVVTERWGRSQAPHSSSDRHAAAGARPLLLAAAQERSRAAAAARRQASGAAVAIVKVQPIASFWRCASGELWRWQLATEGQRRLWACWGAENYQKCVMHVWPSAMEVLATRDARMGAVIGLLCTSQSPEASCLPTAITGAAQPACERRATANPA